MFTRYTTSIVARVCTLVVVLTLTSCDTMDNTPSPEDYFSDPDVVALARAAASGDTRTIDRLVVKGVDVNAIAKDGTTPLWFATLSKKGFVRLLEQGADPNIACSTGECITSIVAGVKDIEFLELVLAHGGNPNFVNATTGRTALCEAILRRLGPNVKLLIESGADVNAQDGTRDTPLTTAGNINAFNIVYMLLEAGADHTIQNNWGYTVTEPILTNNVDPEHELFRWRAKVIKLLEARGVDFEEEKRKIAALQAKRKIELRAIEDEWIRQERAGEK